MSASLCYSLASHDIVVMTGERGASRSSVGGAASHRLPRRGAAQLSSSEKGMLRLSARLCGRVPNKTINREPWKVVAMMASF